MTPRILLNMLRIQKSKRNLSMLKLESLRAFCSDQWSVTMACSIISQKDILSKRRGGRRGEVGEMVGGISFGWGCQEKYSHTRLHLHTHIYTYADHIISGAFNTDIVLG